MDIVIIGGGLAGLALALALRRTALNIALIEGRAPQVDSGEADWDARIYAISPINTRFLDQLGIWSQLDPTRLCPVKGMDVQGDAGGRLAFSAYDSGVSELACIVESSAMQRQLWQAAQNQDNLTLLCPAQPQALALEERQARLTLVDGRELQASLIVAADGADSWTRNAAGIDVKFKPYEQMGVVANFVAHCTHRGHRQIARQWFGRHGILAWLPLPENRISMVWSTPSDHARELLSLAASQPTEFCRRVAAAGDFCMGDLTLLTAPQAFPLRLMRAPHSVKPRLALIGDAAHTIHPLSGHGVNLGFQDAQTLAKVLSDNPIYADCGNFLRLRMYERARKAEVVALQTMTDGLYRLFQPSAAPLSFLRNLGLNFTDRAPVLKDALVRYALAS